MKRHDKVRLTVYMDVTKAQALSLMSMFRYWNALGGLGSSRHVAFMADGDGDFHPNCQIITKPYLKLNDEMYKFAFCKLKEEKQGKLELNLNDGDALFDYDKIGWKLLDEEEKIKKMSAQSDNDQCECVK